MKTTIRSLLISMLLLAITACASKQIEIASARFKATTKEDFNSSYDSFSNSLTKRDRGDLDVALVTIKFRTLKATGGPVSIKNDELYTSLVDGLTYKEILALGESLGSDELWVMLDGNGTGFEVINQSDIKDIVVLNPDENNI